MLNYTDIIDESKSLLQEITLPANKYNIKTYVKRDDLLHPEISGNKWRKLKYNLIKAKELGHKILLTFGGAYSNHIYAVASAGKIFGFKTIGIIRGEEHLPLNSTLKFAANCGMDLHYLDRTTYRNRNEISFQNGLIEKYGNAYVIPEGGSNLLALKGVAEIIDSIKTDYTHICCANGTGGTIAGIICGLKGNKKVIGFPSLKGAGFLNEVVNQFICQYSEQHYTNYSLILDYHFGGYAKINYDLVKFMDLFYSLNNISLDPIYTSKMMYGINNLIEQKYFHSNDVIIAVHTGGLQGLMGMDNKINHLRQQNK
ncbi:MAG: pyridoxal-phosphate dependent enzyme [bacterium]